MSERINSHTHTCSIVLHHKLVNNIPVFVGVMLPSCRAIDLTHCHRYDIYSEVMYFTSTESYQDAMDQVIEQINTHPWFMWMKPWISNDATLEEDRTTVVETCLLVAGAIHDLK